MSSTYAFYSSVGIFVLERWTIWNHAATTNLQTTNNFTTIISFIFGERENIKKSLNHWKNTFKCFTKHDLLQWDSIPQKANFNLNIYTLTLFKKADY